MRVILCAFFSPLLRDTALHLQDRGVEISYIIGRKFDKYFKNGDFPGTIFHSTYDAIQAKPAPGVDVSKFKPIGADLIRDMLECESLVMGMMNRVDFSGLPYNKRLHLYYKYLEYWNGVINTIKPDAIIMRSIPHAIYDFVLFYLAERYNIPTISFDFISIKDRLMPVFDYRKMSEQIRDEYNKIINEQHVIEELDPYMQDYYLTLIDPKKDARPEYVLNQLAQSKQRIRIFPPWDKIINNFKKGNLFNAAKFYIKSIMNFGAGKQLNINEDDMTNYETIYQLKKSEKIKEGYYKEFLKYKSEINFGKKYVYFPLHYQPEASTSPCAGYFADLILIAKILSYSVPKDWEIYIKESPLQWSNFKSDTHLGRFKGYYKELAELKNIKLISPETSTYELISKAQAVAVATGTAGWEAISRGTPALVFGYPWYMYCDGVFRINNAADCQVAIEKIIGGYKIEPQKILNYLIAFERATIKGYSTPYRQKESSFPAEKSIQNMSNFIYQKLVEIKASKNYG